jgi:hypothetical protein
VDSLFPIEPCGAGTSEVESFNSYFYRLATCHSMSPGQLAKFLSQWHSGLEQSKPARYLSFEGSLCSVSSTTQSYLDVVSRCTGVHGLERTTLMPLEPIVSPSLPHSLKPSRAWCPACYRDSEARQETIYDRLAWCLLAVRRCPFHNILLHTNCPSCHSRQPHLSAASTLSVCRACRETLVADPCDWRICHEPSFAERDCFELVGAIADGSFKIAGPDPLRTFVTEVRRRFPDLSLSPLHALANLDRPRSYPTLYTLLKVAGISQVPLLTILGEPVGAAASAANLGFRNYKEPCMPHPRRQAALAKKVRQLLQTQLARPTAEIVPPFEALSRELSVSCGFIRGREPELSWAYANRCAAQRKRTKRRSIARIRRALSGGLLQAYAVGEIRTRRTLADVLSKSCSVSIALARQQIKIAIQEAIGEAKSRCHPYVARERLATSLSNHYGTRRAFNFKR